MKQVICLFKLYTENELASSVEWGLNAFNEAVAEYSTGSCPEFNPGGRMSDEAGGISLGLENIYG